MRRLNWSLLQGAARPYNRSVRTKPCGFHPTTFWGDEAKFGNFPTINSDRDDFAAVDAVEYAFGGVASHWRTVGNPRLQIRTASWIRKRAEMC